MTDDAPPVRNYPGRWDEVAAALIILLPWVAGAALLGYALLTGAVTPDVRLAGTIPVEPLAYVVTGLCVLTYLLALAKFFGPRLLAWLARRLHNTARNYNP